MIYSIEGNVGSGKSTLVAELEKRLKIENVKILFLPEPVDLWTQIVDPISQKNILELYYNDQKTYSFSFQMLAYITRLNLITQMVEENPDAIIITERSVYGDRAIFAKMLFDSGKMKPVEYQIYNMCLEYFEQKLGSHTFIYLNTPAQVCQERVIKRSRKGEKLPTNFLVDCDKYHNEWMEKEYDLRGGHKFVLEYTLDQEQMINAIKDVITLPKCSPHSSVHYTNYV
ncbi:MAG: hypothetical protein CMM25_07345 [Rhodospirillaceae bacterium]|nr:hypothetical protein [Rhodospirillaceae bacterium]|tara:strand:- start:943 stop:1626 length:684 start_codon:yes stop_codon:yes gene_type:complete